LPISCICLKVLIEESSWMSANPRRPANGPCIATWVGLSKGPVTVRPSILRTDANISSTAVLVAGSSSFPSARKTIVPLSPASPFPKPAAIRSKPRVASLWKSPKLDE